MSTDAPLSLPDDPALLKALLLRERAQSAAVTAHLEQTVQSQQKKIDQQQHEIARLLRRLYGPRQERIDPDKLLLFDGDDLTVLAAELAQELEAQPAQFGRNPKKGHGRRELLGAYAAILVVGEGDGFGAGASGAGVHCAAVPGGDDGEGAVV